MHARTHTTQTQSQHTLLHIISTGLVFAVPILYIICPPHVVLYSLGHSKVQCYGLSLLHYSIVSDLCHCLVAHTIPLQLGNELESNVYTGLTRYRGHPDGARVLKIAVKVQYDGLVAVIKLTLLNFTHNSVFMPHSMVQH